MGTLAYPFEVRDSNNTTTDNRKTGLTPTVSNGKTLAASPATVTAAGNVSVVEIGAGIYAALYDAEANGDAAFPVDWGSALTNPNDRYGSLVLTRDAGRIIANLDAQVSTRLAASGYAAGLDATGVRAAVGLASANLDTQLALRTGYKLAADGLDAVAVETNLNARQALALNSGLLAGSISGATSIGGTCTISGAGVSATRAVITGDAYGNRTGVILTPPN